MVIDHGRGLAFAPFVAALFPAAAIAVAAFAATTDRRSTQSAFDGQPIGPNNHAE
jgi:hypothetical protein